MGGAAQADRRLEPRPGLVRPRADGERVARRGGGGLVTALRSLVAHHDVTWIASAMTRGGPRRRRRGRRRGDRGGRPRRLALPAAPRRARPGGVRLVLQRRREPDALVPPALPLGRSRTRRTSTAGSTTPGRRATCAVNAAFAEAVVAELERRARGGRLLPRLPPVSRAAARARPARPDATLAHFVHIPWPQPDYWHVLPERRSAAPSTTGCSRTTSSASTRDRWRRNFLRSLRGPRRRRVRLRRERCVDHERRRARSSPRGRSRSTRPSSTSSPRATRCCAEERRDRGSAGPSGSILRVDRTDPSKNVVRGFRAFELFLDAHPEMHGRVGMLALLDPSRQDIPEYAEYLGAIQRAARARQRPLPAATAGRRSTSSIEDNFPQAVAAYKQFDVLLVNAIFDGMNLVAKEAPLVNERDGVLVLSENAGAHEELGEWALTRQPVRRRGPGRGDPRGARRCRADERAPRLEAIREHVREHDVAAWIDDAARRPRPLAPSHATPLGDERALARRRDAGGVRMVDVGGKAGLAPAGGRSGDACGWRRRRRGGCASCRRATRSRPRSSPGSWPRSGRAS